MTHFLGKVTPCVGLANLGKSPPIEKEPELLGEALWALLVWPWTLWGEERLPGRPKSPDPAAMVSVYAVRQPPRGEISIQLLKDN